MSIVLADVGALAMLNKYFKNVLPSGGNNYTLKLFTNNVTPASDGSDTAGTYTEAAGGGYASVTLIAANFTCSIASGIAQVAYAAQSFIFSGALTGPADIYGCFVVDADGTLVYADRLATKYTPAASGDTLAVTPVFQLSKGVPA